METKMKKINSVTVRDTPFLSVLETIHNPPESLSIIGTVPPTRQLCVAIVGTRQPSIYGREVSYRLSYDLAKRGVCVVSGLALGVDAIAHQAALDAGGVTIAFLAGGLHRIYPSQHQLLGEAIVRQGGALLSEYPRGVEARRYHFLARNRLISGLVDAVVVTEAAERSGTLSTVGHALEQNKEVFAVPGPITSHLSVGPNRLIQQGAHVALSAKDILDVIAPHLTPAQLPLIPQAMTPLEATIIDLLGRGIRNGDELLKQSKAETSDFLQTLTMMEIHGVIRPLGGNNWTLRDK